MNVKNIPLAKKDFEKMLNKALAEQAQTIIEAVNFGFEKAKEDRTEIKNKLASLERRVIHIEDVITKHSKEIRGIRGMLANHSRILAEHSRELREIKQDLKELKTQKEPLGTRIVLLEQKVAQLEAEIA